MGNQHINRINVLESVPISNQTAYHGKNNEKHKTNITHTIHVWYVYHPPLSAWGMTKLAFHKTIGFMKCRNHVDFSRTKQEILIKCRPAILLPFLWNATSLQITTPYTKCRDCMKTFPIMNLSGTNQHRFYEMLPPQKCWDSRGNAKLSVYEMTSCPCIL